MPQPEDDGGFLAIFCMFLTLLMLIFLILRHGGI